MTDAILVWNPNPTLDVVSEVSALAAGGVHRADRQEVAPGGKGTLVLRTLAALGVDSHGVAPLAGPTGNLVGELFERDSLPIETTEVDGQTRVAVSIVDGATGTDTVVNGPGPTTGGPAWEAHLVMVERLLGSGRFRTFVVAGRPPLGGGDAGLARLCGSAGAQGLRVVLDLSSPFSRRACGPSRGWSRSTTKRRERWSATASRLKSCAGAARPTSFSPTDRTRSRQNSEGTVSSSSPPACDRDRRSGAGTAFSAPSYGGCATIPTIRRSASAGRPRWPAPQRRRCCPPLSPLGARRNCGREVSSAAESATEAYSRAARSHRPNGPGQRRLGLSRRLVPGRASAAGPHGAEPGPRARSAGRHRQGRPRRHALLLRRGSQRRRALRASIPTTAMSSSPPLVYRLLRETLGMSSPTPYERSIIVAAHPRGGNVAVPGEHPTPPRERNVRQLGQGRVL